MHILFSLLIAAVAYGGQCPSNSDDAFKRFEQIQSVNGAAHALSGTLLFTIQPIENAPRADGSSAAVGGTLYYTLRHQILPGRSSTETVIPVGNTPKAEGHLTYGIDKIKEFSKILAETMAENGVTPFAVGPKFKPQSYLSHAMFYVTSQSSEAQTLERAGRKQKVFHYQISPKPYPVLKREGEKRKRAQLSGDIWLDAETCMPILMIGALEDTAWAVVDKFQVEFGSKDLGFYPTRMFIRTFVALKSRVLSGIFSLGQGIYQSSEITIAYQSAPDFRAVHTSLLDRIRD